jgi:hypothetical protein
VSFIKSVTSLYPLGAATLPLFGVGVQGEPGAAQPLGLVQINLF